MTTPQSPATDADIAEIRTALSAGYSVGDDYVRDTPRKEIARRLGRTDKAVQSASLIRLLDMLVELLLVK